MRATERDNVGGGDCKEVGVIGRQTSKWHLARAVGRDDVEGSIEMQKAYEVGATGRQTLYHVWQGLQGGTAKEAMQSCE